jgi:hypothetical protein
MLGLFAHHEAIRDTDGGSLIIGGVFDDVTADFGIVGLWAY